MTETTRWQQRWLIYLCLAVVTAGVYWPVRHFEFTNYDDPMSVSENRHVQGRLALRGLIWACTTPLDQWMPVTWLARMLEGQLFGLNAGPYHVVNALFHIANTLLLFGVLNRMTAARWRSALVAALFALHPLQVESVAWVTGLKDVLSMFLGLLTIGAYVKYVDEFPVHGPRVKAFYALTLLLFALALMAKPMMVTLPFVLLLLDYWPLGRTRWAKPAPIRSRLAAGANVEVDPARLLKEKLPFFALTAASCVVTYWAQRSVGAVASLEKIPLDLRIANALVAYVSYLGKAIWPTRLAVFYPLNTNLSLAAVVAAGVGLAGVTTVVIWRARREPWLATGWFWYLGTLVPVIGLVHVGVAQAMADRYAYVPLVGPFIMLCWSIPLRVVAGRVQKSAVTAATVALLGFSAVFCRRQIDCWKDSETLFRHALLVTESNSIAHDSLGLALWQAGQVPEALAHYEQALRVNPDSAEAHNNLAFALFKLGKVPEAMEHFERAVRARPDYAEARYNLGLALSKLGRPREAIAQYQAALRVDPDHVRARNNLGAALTKLGRLREAIRQYEEALQTDPDYREAQNNLAWLLATLTPADGGDPARAVALARRACETGGSRVPEQLDTLAAAYAATGQFAEAITVAQRAIELSRAAGQPESAREIETRLQLYRSGRPYRLSIRP